MSGETYSVAEMLRCDVSIFSSVYDRKAKRYPLGSVLNSFATHRYAGIIRKARVYLHDGDSEMYKACKAMLPVVTFCGVFEGGHSKAHLVQYNNIVVIDIDHLDDASLPTVVRQLQQDEYIFACWLSPSGKGLKALVHISKESDGQQIDNHHLRAFRQLTAHFKTMYGIDIDQSGSDYSRLCYACWDENLTIKDTARVFPVEDKGEIAVGTARVDPLSTKRESVHHRKRAYSRKADIDTVEDIIRYLQHTGRSITYDYDSWVRVAYAIAATFTPKTGLTLFLQLSQQDADKYDEEACRRMFDYCYSHSDGQVTLGTIVYLARAVGYDDGRRRL